MKKYKPNRIGLNPEWFKIYVFIPLLVIVTIVISLFFVKLQVENYIEQKTEQESIRESEMIEEESIKESESIERYLKESIRKEYENRIHKSKISNAEDMNDNEKYKNSLLKEKWPHGTYVYDKNKDIYGVVSYCEIPVVYTKEGWSFEVNYDNFQNNNIIQTGWLQWHNWTKKQEKNKKLSKEEKDKLDQIIKEENVSRTRNAKKIFPPNPVHGKCFYKGDYYFIYDWNNGLLKLKNAISNEKKYLYVYYDDKDIRTIKPNELKNFYVKE